MTSTAPVLARISRSPLLWLLLFIVLVDVSLRMTQVETHQGEEYAGKLVRYLSSADNRDILLLGSSVATAASYYADTTIDNTLPRDHADLSYSDAKYLERCLSQTLGRPVTIANLTAAGCMASDVALIVTRAFEFNKTPRLLIYELFPRDLTDPTMPQPGQTPYGKVLSGYHSGLARGSLSLEDIKDAVLCSPLAAFVAASLDPNTSGSAREQRQRLEALISSAWYFYRVRTDFLEPLLDSARVILNREITLHDSVSKRVTKVNCAARPNSGAPVRTAAQIRAGTDWAPHKLRLDQEGRFFTRMLRLCKEHTVPVVIVNMPVSQAYMDLLDPSLYQRYLDFIRSQCRSSQALFIDLNDSGRFFDSDFKDATHTNASGGTKIQQCIAGSIGDFARQHGLFAKQ